MLTADTLASLREGRVPAEVLPDALTGWCGPVEAYHLPITDLPGKWYPSINYGDGTCTAAGGFRERWPAHHVRLPLTHPECRFQVARVMAAGVRCPNCWSGDGRVNPVDCPCFPGEGWLRKPTPLFHFLPRSEGGQVENEEWAVGLLACSVARVVVGLPPLVGLLGGYVWTALDYGAWARPVLVDSKGEARGVRNVVHSLRGGTSKCWDETAERRAAADAAALAHGFALVNGDGSVVLPWPEVSNA